MGHGGRFDSPDERDAWEAKVAQRIEAEERRADEFIEEERHDYVAPPERERFVIAPGEPVVAGAHYGPVDPGYAEANPWSPSVLPSDAAARKECPIYSGVLRYFPRALAAVAHCSKVGNDQHNPGAPLHWDRAKSQDEHDALVRHLIEAGTVDTDGVRHSAKVAWRALAALEKELEAAGD